VKLAGQLSRCFVVFFSSYSIEFSIIRESIQFNCYALEK
jgi:hypothetical protein